MKINGATKQEKNILEGMVYILNQDLCGPFECPTEGCENCPIHNALALLDRALIALESIPMIEG